MSRYIWDSSKSNLDNVNAFNLMRAEEESRDLLQRLLNAQQPEHTDSTCDLLIKLVDKSS